MTRRKFSAEKINKVKKSIKVLMTEEDISNIKTVAELVHKKNPEASPDAQNLYDKINKGTLKHIEFLEILDVLDYDFKIEKRK